MITVLSAKFAQVSATQTEFWCKLKNQIKSKTNKGKAKRHKVMPTMQQTRRSRQNIADLLKGYELRTNYAKNTISISSCDLEQAMPTKCPSLKYV